MTVVNEGLDSGASESESLLDAFIETGDFDDAEYLQSDEAPNEAAEAATDVDQPETDGEETEETETEATDAKDADADDEGDFVEIDNEDGTTERLSVSDLLAAYNTTKEIGTDANQIRQQIAEAATAQIQERTAALDTQISQVLELYGTLFQLTPEMSEPSQELLNENSQYYNPAAYREQMQAYQNVTQIMDGAKEKMQELNEQYQYEAIHRQNLQAQKDWAALTAVDSSWLKGDSEKRLETLRASSSEAYGIEPQLIGGITNPGFIRMAEDAKAYREAKAKGIKPKAKTVPRLVKGGAGSGKAKTGNSAKKAKANAHLQKTGEVADLEAVWGDFL